MNESEEYDLFHSVKEHGFEDIADKLKKVLDKRDVQLDDLHSTLTECRTNLHDKMDELVTSINVNSDIITELRNVLDTHMETEEFHYQAESKKNDERYKKLFDAFPDKDARAHLDYHLKVMKKNKASAMFREKMTTHIATIVATGIVILLGLSIWEFAVNKAYDHSNQTQQVQPNVKN